MSNVTHEATKDIRYGLSIEMEQNEMKARYSSAIAESLKITTHVQATHVAPAEGATGDVTTPLINADLAP